MIHDSTQLVRTNSWTDKAEWKDIFKFKLMDLPILFRTFLLQVHKSFSLVASFLSTLTIGLMITCIISVLIIIILSYQKNLFNRQDKVQDMKHLLLKSTNDSTEMSYQMYEMFDSLDSTPSESTPDEKVLKMILLLEGVFYCTVNIGLLGKWVGLKIKF